MKEIRYVLKSFILFKLNTACLYYQSTGKKYPCPLRGRDERENEKSYNNFT